MTNNYKTLNHVIANNIKYINTTQHELFTSVSHNKVTDIFYFRSKVSFCQII
jgi:hypothetical protein